MTIARPPLAPAAARRRDATTLAHLPARLAARRTAPAAAAAMAVVATLAAAPRPARACAACGCGDPTLTAMGLEKPFQNRVRLAVDERFGGIVTGPPEWQERTYTLRSSIAASWSPTSRLTVAALLPIVSTFITTPGTAWENATGLGDAELSVRGIVLRDRAFSPRHVLSLLGGLELPTGPRLSDSAGYPLPDDVQAGSGSWDPFAGAAYAFFGGTWSAFASLSYRYTTVGRRDYRRGSYLGATVGVQAQPLDRVAFGASLDLHQAEPDTLPDGQAQADSGGAMLAVTPTVTVAVTSRWLLRAGAQLHVLDELRGHQSESTTFLLSSVVDLN